MALEEGQKSMYEVKFFGTVKQFEVDKLIDLQMLSDMIIAHIFSFQFVLIDVLGYITFYMDEVL